MDGFRDKPDKNYMSRFFDLPATSPSVLKRIAVTIKKQDEELHFIKKISEEVGFPNWKGSVVIYPGKRNNTNSNGNAGSLRVDAEGFGAGILAETDTMVFIPIVKSGKQNTSSFLVGIVDEEATAKLRLARGDLYPAYGMTKNIDTVSSEVVALQCMYLDLLESESERKQYRINDLRLFRYEDMHLGNASRFISLQMQPQQEEKVDVLIAPAPNLGPPCVNIVVDEYYGVFGSAPPAGEPDGSVPGSYCINVQTWVDFINQGMGNYTTVGGGSGGCGNWSCENPCRIMPGSSPCNGPEGGGWAPVTENVGVYDPNLYDTIIIEDIIRDSFPCLYTFLNDSLPNLNYMAQIAGASVFKDSAFMHLKFKISSTYTDSTHACAHTNAGGATVDSDGNTHFLATVNFNPWYIRKGTKEFTISTIIHEVMHAIFSMRWSQYQKWLQFGPPNDIDSNWMKAHYPQYWLQYTQQAIPISQVDDHEIMATDYTNYFQELLCQFWNPASPRPLRDSIVKSLAFGGLYETTAWRILGMQGIDTCRYKAINASAERSRTSAYNVTGCGIYSLHYADSIKLRPSCD